MGSNFWTHNGRAWLGPSDGPIFSRREFLDCAVASFVVRSATWLEISEIVFVNSTTEVLSACVAVARFSSATVWSCYNSVKSAALACAVCIFAAYPSVFEVLDDLCVSLKALSKWALNLLQVFSSLGFRDHFQQSSWYSLHFSMFAYAIRTIWSDVCIFCTAAASWFHSIFSKNSSKRVLPEIGSFVFWYISCTSSYSSSAYSVMRWDKIWKPVTFAKPMIRLERGL